MNVDPVLLLALMASGAVCFWPTLNHVLSYLRWERDMNAVARIMRERSDR